MMNVQKGDVLLDVGAGKGYFAIPALKYVGESGQVIAADISQQMLDLLVSDVHDAQNLTLLLCDKNNVPVPENSVDKILMAFVLHEVDNAVDYLKMLLRLLKRDGKLFIVEWSPVESPMGPPLHERLSKEAVENYFSAAGYELLRFEDINDFQYFCEAVKMC